MVKSQYIFISGKQLIKMLDKKFGVEIIKQRGSHIKIKILSSNKITIIPNHKELAYGTFSGILKQLQVDENDFLNDL